MTITSVGKTDIPIMDDEPDTIIMDGKSAGIYLRLSFQDQTLQMNKHLSCLELGRGLRCHIVVSGHWASRVHARIELHGGQFYLIDQSVNGTYVVNSEGEKQVINRQKIQLRGDGVIGLGRLATSEEYYAIKFSCSPNANKIAETTSTKNEVCSVKTILESSLAADMTTQECEQLASLVQRKVLVPGEVLIRQDTVVDYLYCVLRGSLSVLVKPPRTNKDLVVNRLECDDLVGVFGVLTDVKSTATVKAIKEAEVLSLDLHKFRDLMETNPTISMKILRAVVRSVRNLVIALNVDKVKRTRGVHPNRERSVDAAPMHWIG